MSWRERLMDFFHMMTCRDQHCGYCNDFPKEAPKPMMSGGYNGPPKKDDDDEETSLNEIPASYLSIQSETGLKPINTYQVNRMLDMAVWYLKGGSTLAAIQIKQAASWRGKSRNGRKSKFKRRETSLPTLRGKYDPSRHD